MPWYHILGNALILSALFALGSLPLKLKKRQKETLVPLFAAATCIILLSRINSHRPDLFVRVFPFQDIMFYTNFYAYAAALFAPLAPQLGKTKFQKMRIGFLSGALFGVALLPYRYFLLPDAKSFANRIDE